MRLMGGRPALREFLRVTDSAVTQWMAKNHLPDRHVVAVKLELERRKAEVPAWLEEQRLRMLREAMEWIAELQRAA